jgi:hypothetical protein
MHDRAIRIERCLGPATALQPGQYTLETASGLPAVCCPICSGIAELAADYEVDEQGQVTPAWKCPSCAFWELIVLNSEAVLG